MQKPIILPPLCAPPGQFPVPLPCFPPPSCSPCSPQPCCPPPCGPCFPPCCPPKSHPPCCPPMCCSPPYAPCGPMAPASPRCPLPPCIPGQTKFSNCGSCGGRSTIVRVPKGCCPPPCRPCCPCLNVSNCCTPCYPRCACCTNCCPPPCCNEPCQPGQQSNPENDKPPCFNNCNFYCTEMPKGKFSLKPSGENEVCQSTDSFDDCIGSGSPAGGIPKGDVPRRPPSRFLNRAAGDDQLAPVPRRSPPRRSDKRESFSSTTESPSYSSSSYEYSRSRKHVGSPPREQEVVATSLEHNEDSVPENFPRRVDGFLKPVKTVCISRDKCRETGEDPCAPWPSRDNATGDGKSVSGKSERLSLSTIPSLKTSCLAPPNTYISSTNSARLTAMTLKSLCVDSVTDNRSSFIVGPAASVKCIQSRQKSRFVTANQSSLKSTCIKTVVRRKGQVETRDASATSHRTVFVGTSKTSNQDKVCETIEFSRMQASSVNNTRSSNYGCAPGKHSHGENIRRLSTTFSNSKKPEKLRTKLEWEFQQPFYYTRLNDEYQGPSKTSKLSNVSGDIPRRSPRYADCRQCTGDGLHSFTSTISNQPSLKKYPLLHRNSFPSNQSQQSGDTRKKLSALWDTDKNGRIIKVLGNKQKNDRRKESGFYPKAKSISKEIVPSQVSGLQTCENYSGIRREEGAILNPKKTTSRIAVETLTVNAEEPKTYEEDPTEILLEKKCSTQTTYHQQTCISRYRNGGGDQSREHELCVVTCVVQESTKWSPPFKEDGDKVRLPPQNKTNGTYSASASLVDDKERVCSNVVIEEIIEPINDNNGAEHTDVSDCKVTRVGSPSSVQALSANDCAVEEPAPLTPFAPPPPPVITICKTDYNPFELNTLDGARGSCAKRSLSFILPSVIKSGKNINGIEQLNNKSESEVISVPRLVENSTNLSVSHFRKKRKAKRRLLDQTLLCNNDVSVVINCVETECDSNNQVNKIYVNDKII